MILKSVKTTAVFALVMLLMLCVCASAGIVDQKTSTLKGSGNVQQLICDAVVTLDGGIYTYTYTLTYDIGPATVHIYKVQNPNYASYYNASNTPNDAGIFTNPANGNSNWIGWQNGALDVGGSRVFSYQSSRAPMDIDVYCYAVDGGSAAIGKTLGMGETIPEPSSLLVLAFGAVGTGSLIIRRRK
ncbi:MAG: PEP-CTERM sorting domain-containing protein [Armatimonadota bacterium]